MFSTYALACEVLQLQTLEERRVELCVKFARNVLTSDLYRDWLPQSRGDVSGRETRNGNKLDYMPVRTKRFKTSPIPYLTNLLNEHVLK